MRTHDTPEIRDATEADIAALASLMRELGYPTTVNQMRRRMGSILPRDDFATLVAELDEEIVAMAGMNFAQAFELDEIYARVVVLVVTSGARSRGIGRMLLDACEERAVRKGARNITLASNLRRSAAHQFYEERGYSKSGYRFVK